MRTAYPSDLSNRSSIEDDATPKIGILKGRGPYLFKNYLQLPFYRGLQNQGQKSLIYVY
jgi:hypothetical protein